MNKCWTKLSGSACETNWTTLSGSTNCVLKVIRMRLFAPRRDWAGWAGILDFLDIDFHWLTFLTWTTIANLSSTIVIFDFYRLSWHSLTFQPPSYYVWTIILIILINGFSITINKSRVTIFCQFYPKSASLFCHESLTTIQIVFQTQVLTIPYVTNVCSAICHGNTSPVTMLMTMLMIMWQLTRHMWRCWWPIWPCWWLCDG